MGEVSRRRDWQRRGPQARRVVCLVAVLCLAPACAATQEPVSVPPETSEVQGLRSQLAERDRQLRQLEGRLALLEASQRELRYALAEKASPVPRETVRIGERAAAGRAVPAVQAQERPARTEDKEGARPVLRLYQDRPPATRSSGGAASSTTSTTSGSSLWTVPQVDERLPIAPVPTLAAVAQRKVEEPSSMDAAERYRYAIDLVRKREFVEALQVLNAFLTQYADDVRVPKVMFWQGEVLFAQRAYARALAAYERSLSREPTGEKAADTLLKIGLCHQHLGDPDRAQKALEKLRIQFPDSAAARMLAREDA